MGLFSGFVGMGENCLRARTPQRLFDALEPRQMLAGEPFAPGHTVVELQTTHGNIWIELYDQEAPQTVANFMDYVEANRYDNTFMHRHAVNFVLQMGGYEFVVDDDPIHIETFPPVQNEFSATRSNLVRTVAMAKTANDPNSATSEFFFNLGDNASNLDTQNGGFTVFGQVVNGWDVVLAITRLQRVDAGGAFDNLPVRENYTGGDVLDEHLVKITDVVPITNITWDQHGNGGRNVTGAATINGETLFVTVSPLGRPIAFYQSAATSGWQVSDIGLQTGAPAIAGQTITWADPKDGRFYVAAPTVSGLLLFTRNSDGFWKARNLNDEIPAASFLPVSTGLTTFTSTGDQTSTDIVSIAGLTSEGHIVLFTQASKTATNGNYPWTFVNVHGLDLAPRGMATPAFVGPLVSYVTSWNGQNIVGLDSSGRVQAVWRSPGFDTFRWRVDDLSTLTGAPALTGGLTPYLTPWGGVNLAGTNSGGKVVVTWWNGDPSLGWNTNNLSDEFGGTNPTPLVVGSLSSYVYPWGGLNVAGRSADGKIIVYWWGGPGDLVEPTWKVTVLTDFISGATPVNGSISTTISPAGQINLTGLSNNGEVLRYNWKPDGAWNVQNLTTLATFW